MRIAGLRIGWDLANEVHGALYFKGVPLFFSLHYQGSTDHLCGGYDVEQKGFSLDGRNQDRGL